MKYLMVALKDELTGFQAPTIEVSAETAIRNFTAAVNSIKAFQENPQDYSLYRIGYFDTDTGIIETSVDKLVSANSVLRKVDTNEVQNSVQ